MNRRHFLHTVTTLAAASALPGTAAFAAELQLPRPVARLLAARGFGDVAAAEKFLRARLSDLTEVARHIRGHKVRAGVKAIVVPGSQGVAALAESMGLAAIFREAGFEWRGAGCSMCLGMNPDKLVGDQLCASSSNRNFKGRQGSPTGRTVLMSPLMVAAAAVTGEISDAREIFNVR